MHRGSKRWWTGPAALGLALAVGGACSSGPAYEEPVVEESTGALGQGTFRWQCVGDSDPTCGTGVFPRMVAVGARFDLEFFPDSDLPEQIFAFELGSVSPRRIDAQGDGFVVRSEGEASILATGDGYGVDYIVLDARPVDRIVLRRMGDDDATGTGGPLAQVGVITRVEAVAYSANDLLAGALDYEWDNLTPDVIDVIAPSGNQVQLFGVREGTARLALRAGDHAEIIEVTVTEAPPPDPTTGGEETEVAGYIHLI